MLLVAVFDALRLSLMAGHAVASTVLEARMMLRVFMRTSRKICFVFSATRSFGLMAGATSIIAIVLVHRMVAVALLAARLGLVALTSGVRAVIQIL